MSLWLLPTRSSSCCQCHVFFKCDHDPKLVPGDVSLTSSIGHIELQKLRHEKQSANLMAQDRESLPSPSRDCAAAKQKR